MATINAAAIRFQREALARREAVRELCEQGLPSVEIAHRLKICERTVWKHRNLLGLTTPTHVWEWTDDQVRLAGSLLEDGCPYTEVARTIGCHAEVVMRKFPGFGRSGNPLGNGRHNALAAALGLELLQ